MDGQKNKIILPDDLDLAVPVLQAGGVIAFPTETYYGLAVDPFNTEALARLFAIKRRAIQKPVLTVIHEIGQLKILAKTSPECFQPLIKTFWPGPLTLIFEAVANLPLLLTGNTGTVGVRISSHPVARLLVESAGRPLTATSANISGHVPAVSAAEVRRQLGDAVDLIVDGGRTSGGKGSTIVGCQENKLTLIREGVLPFSDILASVTSARP